MSNLAAIQQTGLDLERTVGTPPGSRKGRPKKNRPGGITMTGGLARMDSAFLVSSPSLDPSTASAHLAHVPPFASLSVRALSVKVAEVSRPYLRALFFCSYPLNTNSAHPAPASFTSTSFWASSSRSSVPTTVAAMVHCE